ncbi:ABC transporter permease [Marinoscillum furvescens]|uniref:FtsX-like permease family protein n=1 Tax=Marinoscillum furvescens DSM 4134 TaxID=1122208 RepID=A0A3D9L721_MARFU|nr:FtsX-like permease family protein [Marinoscillum furvescens]REE00133.1 FtsX-like permease family protein [Marinoscillum furvescens DSM 4134]
MNQPTPPPLARKLLYWRSGNANMEDILGDLDELYAHQVQSSGRGKANRWYWRQVLSICFSYALRKRKTQTHYSSYYSENSLAMLKNYAIIAFRNFSNQKLFTLINIFGLALGMCVCLLAVSISVAIYTSDDHHEHKDRIYQLNTTLTTDSHTKTFGSTFRAAGPYLKEQFPIIEEVVRIESGFRPAILKNGTEIPFRGYFADETFFKVFSFNLIAGDPKTALREPYSLVLTEASAEKLFSDEEALGKIVETTTGRFQVTAIMENPKNTHFFFETLTSYATYEALGHTPATDWLTYRDNYVYTLLQPETSPQQLSDALQLIANEATTFHPDTEIELSAIPLTGVVPRWNISNALGIGWDQPSMLFFLFIGLLVLLPAIFNYTNLSIARALKRAKEIGIRKVVGAEKGQIKAQFMVETVLLTLLALVLSLALLGFIKAEFLKMVIGAQVLDISLNFEQVTAFLLFALTVGILAGLFPAQYFARLNPVQTIKGSMKSGKNQVNGIKKGLFIFQFFISLVFIIGVAVIARQYSYVLNENHGFTSENVLVVPFNGINKQLAINEFSSHPDIASVTTTSSLPGIMIGEETQATANELDTLTVRQVFVGESYFDQMNMQTVWGTSQLAAANQTVEEVVVNEQYLRSIAVFNTPGDSLNLTLADGTRCQVVGILKDFYMEPLNENIRPILFRRSLENSHYALLSVSSSNITQTLDELDERWSGIDQNVRFSPTFLDDEIEKAYYFLSVQIKIFSFLSLLAVTISCLGLLGMVSFTTENRTKEIALRKIMGATDRSLYVLLTREFARLIAISAALAVPFAYFFYDKLFLYMLLPNGKGVGLLEVLISIGFLFGVGFASIYWQTSRVTRANPATSLRYE